MLRPALKLMQSFYSRSWREEWGEEVGQRVFWQKFGQKESWGVGSFYLDGVPSALNHLVSQKVSQSASRRGSHRVHSVSVCWLASPAIKIQTCSRPDNKIGEMSLPRGWLCCSNWLSWLDTKPADKTHKNSQLKSVRSWATKLISLIHNQCKSASEFSSWLSNESLTESMVWSVGVLVLSSNIQLIG